MNWALSFFKDFKRLGTCVSLNLADDQLAALAIQGMLPVTPQVFATS